MTDLTASRIRLLLLIALVVGAGSFYVKGRGYKTSFLKYIIPPHPAIRATRPNDKQTNIDPNSFIAADVSLPDTGHGVDQHTLSDASAYLVRKGSDVRVPAVLNTTGGGDAIVLTPIDPLDADTTYTFRVTAGVKDTAGKSFKPFSMTFTTGQGIAAADFPGGFEKIALPQPTDAAVPAIGLTMGPDHRLYATTVDGRIVRYELNADGTFAASKVITTIQAHHRTLSNPLGFRMVPGLVFDPSSTPENPVVWVTHSQFSFDSGEDWTGKVAKLWGPNLENYQDYVVGLPRSVRDHITARLRFGPDGALYFCQPSNSAMGAPDKTWGKRNEHLLNASILRLDPTRITNPPLDVKTEAGGRYNPSSPDAPLTLYATGVRNTFTMVFHSNGNLYAPGNGSAAGGCTPAFAGGTMEGFRFDYDRLGSYTTPAIFGIEDNGQTEHDYLFKIEKGGYYGHPNPTRNEYVLNGGNPSAGTDDAEVAAYPVGTKPDRNYRGYAHDFGTNASPNGIVEYKSNSFNGALKGKLLVTRYSGGDDVVVLPVNPDGTIGEEIRSIVGTTQLVDPVDIVEDTTNGNLYVAEFGASRISLLRPLAPGASAYLADDRLLFSDPADGRATVPRKVRLRNAGTEPLVISNVNISGADASTFQVIGQTALPVNVRPGRWTELLVAFNAPAKLGIKTASLDIASNDKKHPVVSVSLRGLATGGTDGGGEPSLQRICDLLEIPVNVGDPDPETADMGYNLVTPNDEVPAQWLVKALPDPVTFTPIACYAPSGTPVCSIGWYLPRQSQGQSVNNLFRIEQDDNQSVLPQPVGPTTFDPGDEPFALSTRWTMFDNRMVYSEDKLNTFQTDPAKRQLVHFYRLRNKDGSSVLNAYLVTFEATNLSPDNQDFVGIIRNVKPIKGR